MSHRRRCVAIVGLVGWAVLLLVGVGGSGAAQGDLDPTFGAHGVVTTPFGEEGSPAGVALAPGGKIVVGGWVQPEAAAPFEFGVLRYDATGALDSSFGSGGKSAMAVSAAWENYASALAVQRDGKIVVAGSSVYLGPGPGLPVPTPRKADAALVRFDPDGSVDSGFGTNGRVDEPRGSFGPDGHSYVLQDILIQPDGKIVAAGSDGGDFLLVRYRSDGSLDDSFGAAGIATERVTAGDSGETAFSLARQPDGKLVVAGSPFPTWDGRGWVGHVLLARFNADGSLDRTFGSSGSISTPAAATDGYGLITASSVAVLPDHKIVVGGSAGTGTPTGTGEFLLLRYRSDGSLDRGFGSDGVVRTPSLPGGITALGLQPDGRIVAAGDSWVPDPTTGANTLTASVARYNPDGSLNRIFDAPSNLVGVVDLALQRDGKVVALSGGLRGGSDQAATFALARFLAVSTPCVVPDLHGRSLPSARRSITRAHCALGRVTRAYSAMNRGQVLSQHPSKRTRLPVGGKIALVISRGRR